MGGLANPAPIEDFMAFLKNQIEAVPFYGFTLEATCNNLNFKYCDTEFYSPTTWRNEMSSIYSALKENAYLLSVGLTTFAFAVLFA